MEPELSAGPELDDDIANDELDALLAGFSSAPAMNLPAPSRIPKNLAPPVSVPAAFGPTASMPPLEPELPADPPKHSTDYIEELLDLFMQLDADGDEQADRDSDLNDLADDEALDALLAGWAPAPAVSLPKEPPSHPSTKPTTALVESTGPPTDAPDLSEEAREWKKCWGTMENLAGLGGDAFDAMAQWSLVHLTIWMLTTDAGTDEVGNRRIMHEESMMNLYILLFDGDCIMHQYHIMVRRVLEVMDSILDMMLPGKKIRYYTTIAKVMYLWRENARAIFRAFFDISKELAMNHAYKLPPKPIVGRWGNTSECERRIDAVPLEPFREILTAVVEKRVTECLGVAEKLERKNQRNIDEMGQEDAAAFAQKISKWGRDVLLGICEDMFFIAIQISLKVKGPLDHLLYFLMKVQEHGQPTGLALLVWGNASTIRKELELLLQRSAWEDILGKIDAETASNAWGAIQRVVLSTLADYDRRVMKRLDSDPYRLLLFAEAPPDQSCPKRQQLAQTLLETAPEALHITAAKIKVLFGKALRYVARTGCCSAPLFITMRFVACFWKGDTQEIEGINNLVQLFANSFFVFILFYRLYCFHLFVLLCFVFHF